jgi:hypothetical protein
MRVAQFIIGIIGIILLIAVEIAKVYFIMPFPGSQQSDTIDLAYFIHLNIIWIRIIGILLILFPVIYYFRFGAWKARLAIGILVLAYGVVFYMFNFKFLADKMFLQAEQNVYATVSDNKVSEENLVIGINVNGQPRAYPIQFIGYHHQVRDTVGGSPVMVTYCTVCRTGRVFSPTVDGKPERFRLVGMDHFNAMFEDETTGSWWRQVNGEAIVGELKGKVLPEIASEQMSLGSWIKLYPSTMIMQGDTSFNDTYDRMKGYERGTGGELTGRDSLSWKDKSWVIGVVVGQHARAYDWNELLEKHLINDTLQKTPIAVFVSKDSSTFRVFRRDMLELTYDSVTNTIMDKGTNSTWNGEGVCISGPMLGQQLPVLQSYQEFWHSWKTFRPATSAYRPSN